MSLTPLLCPYCKAAMTCLTSLGYHLGQVCQSEEGKAKQAEYDAGIVHGLKCKVEMIEAPKLVLNVDAIQNTECVKNDKV